jgi:hypothetical protein
VHRFIIILNAHTLEEGLQCIADLLEPGWAYFLRSRAGLFEGRQVRVDVETDTPKYLTGLLNHKIATNEIAWWNQP